MKASFFQEKFVNWLFGKDGALFQAAASGDTDLAGELIAQGANINATSGKGYTALHRAAQSGHADMVKMLIEQGANPKAEAIDKSTPISLATKNGHKDVAELLGGTIGL